VREPELFQRCDNLHRVGLCLRNPDIEIPGGTGIALVANRITADQQVVNAMTAEQPQELFEVVR
jgi:hypothetical protein